MFFVLFLGGVIVFFFHDFANFARSYLHHNIENKPLYSKLQKQYQSKPSEADIYFLGNSILYNYPYKLVGSCKVTNYSIPGDTSELLLARIDKLYLSQQSKLFIMIGVNDIGHGESVDVVYENIKNIAMKLRNSEGEVIISKLILTDGISRNNKEVSKLNNLLNELTNLNFIKLIDFNKALINELTGPSNYTTDGLHLTSEAYKILESKLEAHFGNTCHSTL